MGAPWRPEVLGDACNQMKRNWQSWLPNCLLSQKQQGALDSNNFPEVCTAGDAPFGNGGLSLRNRTWLIRVIETCPVDPRYSGITEAGYSMLPLSMQEDVYYATMLRGLHAPMPHAYEATLFAVESLFADDMHNFYGALKPSEIIGFLMKRWGRDEGVSMYQRMHQIETYKKQRRTDINDNTTNSTEASVEEKSANENESISPSLLRTIPIGFHKPWLYHDRSIWPGDQFSQECKFLKYLF